MLNDKQKASILDMAKGAIGERVKVGLIEADGGKWTLDAKENIADYFALELKDLIESGTIVIVF